MFVVAKVRRIVDSMPNLGNRPSHPEQPGNLATTISHAFLAICEGLYRDDNDTIREVEQMKEVVWITSWQPAAGQFR